MNNLNIKNKIVRNWILQPFDSKLYLESVPGVWTILQDNRYGVFSNIYYEDIINEKFNNVFLRTENITINEKVESVVVLSTDKPEYKNLFSDICTSFIEHQNTNKTESFSPLEWWQSLKELLGNSIKEYLIYDVLAELYTLNFFLESDPEVEWGGPTSSTIDISTKTTNYEVKSTTSKYIDKITVSSQFQLDKEQADYLIFIRLEQSYFDGISIDSLVEEIINKKGLNSDFVIDVEKKLTQLGYPKHSSARKSRFKLLDKRVYEIDDNFPKITKESFKNNLMPDNITKIVYDVSLSGLSFFELE